MKCLTLTEPFATLIAGHEKAIETRGWTTSYRGPIAIHAAKTFRREDAEYALEYMPIREALKRLGVKVLGDLPFGCVVAVARLACVERTEVARQGRFATQNELDFGDFTPGRYAWHLRDVVKLAEPIPARGQLSLWEWDAPPAVLDLIGHSVKEAS